MKRSSAGFLLLGLASCTGGGARDPIPPGDTALEMVFCRSQIASPGGNSQIRVGDSRGLRNEVVIDKTGVEMDARINPDGVRLAFARERIAGNPGSRELYVAWLDQSQRDLRIAGGDSNADDSPSWSPDGDTLVFSSERGGEGRRLWLTSADGQDLRILHEDGSEQDDPDWSTSNDQIVFSRVAPGPARRAALYTVDPERRVPLPLTDGGTATGTSEFIAGDVEPAWSPDASSILFVRRTSPQNAVLMRIDTATRQVVPVTTSTGEDRRPRWSPHGDRIFFAGTRPDDGVDDPRLWCAEPDGGDPVQVFLDPRLDFPGFDVLPAMGPRYDGAVDVASANVLGGLLEIAAGIRTRGESESIANPDGRMLGLATVPTRETEVAGLNLRVPLPVGRVEDIDAIEVEARAALTNVDGDSVLRLAVNDVVQDRNDVAVEMRATDENLVEMRCTLSSLAHVDRNRVIRVEVIGEKQVGMPGELLIDYVAVRVRRRVTDV